MLSECQNKRGNPSTVVRLVPYGCHMMASPTSDTLLESFAPLPSPSHPLISFYSSLFFIKNIIFSIQRA